MVRNVLAEDMALAGCEVKFCDLELERRIGEGAFGRERCSGLCTTLHVMLGEVIKASYLGTAVAVKRMLRSRIDEV